MHEANACLKPLQRMRIERDLLSEELGERLQPVAESLAPDLLRIGELEATDRPAALALARSLVDRGIALKRGPIAASEAAIRRHYRAWHKYATGLAGHITDPEWREYAEARIAGHEAVTWMTIYVGTISTYAAYLPVGRELYEPVPGPQRPDLTPPPLWRCSDARQKGSIEATILEIKADEFPGGGLRPDFSVNVDINCDSIAIEADGIVTLGTPSVDGVISPFGVGLGGFVEASRDRGGDLTLLAGSKATAEAGAVAGDVRSGLFLTFDDNGRRLKAVGGKTDSSQQAGGLTLQPHEMDFMIWEAPPRQEKFNPTWGLNVWQNINPPPPPASPPQVPEPPPRQ
jgi:hypothetical protein